MKLDVKKTVKDRLGNERVRSVKTEILTNRDDEEIVKVLIVYDASKPITSDEMNDVLDALWHSEEDPFPVIYFQEDTDIAPLAAE